MCRAYPVRRWPTISRIPHQLPNVHDTVAEVEHAGFDLIRFHSRKRIPSHAGSRCVFQPPRFPAIHAVGWRQVVVFVIFHGGLLGFEHDQPERLADLLESCPARIDILFGQPSASKFHRVLFEKPGLDIAHLDSSAPLGDIFSILAGMSFGLALTFVACGDRVVLICDRFKTSSFK